jgi:hypothetical protein
MYSLRVQFNAKPLASKFKLIGGSFWRGNSRERMRWAEESLVQSTILKKRLQSDTKWYYYYFLQCWLKQDQRFSYLTKLETVFIAHTIFCFSPILYKHRSWWVKKQCSLPSSDLLQTPKFCLMASKINTAAAFILILALLLVSSGKPFLNPIYLDARTWVTTGANIWTL